MLSRVAEAVYWMARYVERAENVARFIDVNMQLMLDVVVEEEQQWSPLVSVTGDRNLFRELYGEETSQQNVLEFLAFDRRNPNSIVSSMIQARENARSVRETISSEMWELINRFYLFVTGAEARTQAARHPYRFFTEVKQHSQLFIGLCTGTMSHGEAWHFARLGRLLERADKTSRILDVKYFILLPSVEHVGSPIDSIQWSAVLNSASAREMYTKQYGDILPQSVAEFLLLDREFPRSVRYCLIKAEESLHAITESPPRRFSNPAEKEIGRLRSELDFSTIDEILEHGLHTYIDNLQTRLNTIGDRIFETFFAMRPSPGDWKADYNQ